MRKAFLSLVVLVGFLGFGALDAAADTAAKMAAGSGHTCALTAGGGVVCWGRNDYGQLGDGTTTYQPTPVAVSGLASGVTAIAAGNDHTCALTAGGGVVCWGFNGDGELGDGTTTDQWTPVAVSGLTSGVKAIAAGGWHTCAVTAADAVVCWGWNGYGQLGDGTTTDSLTPVAASGLASGVASVAAAGYHTCARTALGAALCWGDNSVGQIGDGTTTQRETPTGVSGLSSGVATIAAAGYHTCAVTSGGAALCWGWNDYGQLGDGTTTQREKPTAVSGLTSGVASIAVGAYQSCALTSGGGVLCWGANWYGQLGDGTTTQRETPVAVSGLASGVASLTGGVYHTCAVTTAGAGTCWGSNIDGQLGDGTTTDRWTPTPVTGLSGGKASSDFTGDLKSDILWRHATQGDVWLWPMDGTTRLSESYVRTIADTNWEIRGQGDQDGDGMADILWRNKTTGEIYFWPMDGATPLGEIYVGQVATAYDIVGTGDFDGDGRSDILWRNLVNGEVWIWLMDGATPLGEVYVATVDLGYVIKGTADLDGDRKADIVWHHASSGEVWVWPMDGATKLSENWVATVPDTGYQIQAVADFDGDRKADILWWHTTRGEVWIWTMNGAAREAETWVGTVPDTSYQIAAAGDYDGDTKADLLWRSVVNGEVWVWLMDGTTKLSETWIASVPELGYRIVK